MLTSLADLVAFEGRDGNNSEPWLSDGTSEGTRMAAFLGPTAAPRAFTRAGGRIYCVSTAQLWVLTGSLD
jgi:ELWxxDGT repeat protein